MGILRFQIPKIEIERIDVGGLISDVDPKECWRFSEVFNEESKTKLDQGLKFEAEILRLLGAMSSLHLRDANPKEPYGPMMVMDGMRTAIPTDFSSLDLSILKLMANMITDVELLARIWDLFWVREEEKQFGKNAIMNYVPAAIRLFDEESWPPYFERLNRAFHIDDVVHVGTSRSKILISEVESRLISLKGSDPLFLTHELALLLLTRKVGSRKIVEKAVQQALASEKNESNPHRLFSYQQLARQYGIENAGS